MAMKLNPEELTVSSFDTSATVAPGTDTLAPARPTTTFTDPTAQTFCYICPEETQRNCW
jgi:hypothetical protein